MRRTRSTSSIYDYARGDGWILPHLDVHTGETAFGDPMHTVVLFYTEGRIEEHETSSVDTLLSQLLDVGAK